MSERNQICYSYSFYAYHSSRWFLSSFSVLPCYFLLYFTVFCANVKYFSDLSLYFLFNLLLSFFFLITLFLFLYIIMHILCIFSHLAHFHPWFSHHQNSIISLNILYLYFYLHKNNIFKSFFILLLHKYKKWCIVGCELKTKENF